MSPLTIHSPSSSALHIDWDALAPSGQQASQDAALRWLSAMPASSRTHVRISNPKQGQRRQLRARLQSLGCTITLTFACIPSAQ